MIKRIIKKVKKLFKKNNDVILHLKELEWAHHYQNSIRGITFIENLNLNVGRWAGNYTFFYILNRILNEYKPKSIVEFGLGESSKFISRYIEFLLKDSNHHIVEQNKSWADVFETNFKLSENSKIFICEQNQINIKGFNINSYTNIEATLTQKYDLYIVDGPFGSLNYSRYDIVFVAQKFEVNDEFIIMIDDYDRKGEKQTAKDLIELLKNKGIKVYSKSYDGKKSVLVIATEKYKYTTSL